MRKFVILDELTRKNEENAKAKTHKVKFGIPVDSEGVRQQ